jgi:hypothetical protein
MSSNQLQRISGNLEGNVFHHLRASRALVLMELQQPSNEKEKTLRGFVLELYAYLALVGNITITSEVGQSSLTLSLLTRKFSRISNIWVHVRMCLRALWYDSQDLPTWKTSNDGRSSRRVIVGTLLSVPNSSTENSELGTAYTKASRHWSREDESVNHHCKNLPERSSHIPSFVILHFKCQRSNPYS